MAFWTKKRRRLLLGYIDEQRNPKEAEPADLNLLYKTFQTWIEALPNLTIFNNFKKGYTGRIPPSFLFGSAAYNPYLKQTKYRPRTRKQLISLLVNCTKDALSKVDSAILLEDGTITSVAKHQFELAGGKRKLKQDALLGRYSKGELKYVDVMREWLINEEEYFTSVNNLLENPDILPHLSRTSKPEALLSVQNTFTLGSNSTLQVIQGDVSTQNNISGSGEQK